METVVLPQNFGELENRVSELYNVLPLLATVKEVPRELQCTKCQKLLIRAYKAACHHHFCGLCIRDMCQTKMLNCPMDAIPLGKSPVRHQKAEKSIESQIIKVEVHCPYGCSKISTILEILGHMQVCDQKKNLDQLQPHKTPVVPDDGPSRDSKLQQLSQQVTQLAVDFNRFQGATEKKIDHICTQLDHLTNQQNETIAVLLNQLAKCMHELEDTVRRETGTVRTEVTSLHNDLMSCTSPNPARDSGRSPRTGQLQWRIANYREAKRLAETQQKLKHRSEEFITELGYHFCMEVYLNGYQDAKGQFLSVLLKLLPGGQDDRLQWPLVGQATVTVLGASGMPMFEKSVALSLDRSVGKIRSILCIPKFLSHAQIDKELGSAPNDFLDLRAVVKEN